MDTQAKLPDHVYIGAYVKVAEWVGAVEDIAVGKFHTMILVSSPKQIYRNSIAEWLEYHPEFPLSILPATADMYIKDCERYQKMSETRVESLALCGNRAMAHLIEIDYLAAL